MLGTCHISVLSSDDKDIEAVSITTTINWPFGAWVVDEHTGIILNNQMSDFSVPGSKNALGKESNPRNFPMPGRRPLSSMVPTIIEDLNSKSVTVQGGSGGPRILPAVFQSIVNTIDWNYNGNKITGKLPYI